MASTTPARGGRQSITRVESERNPLGQASDAASGHSVKIENLSEAKPIKPNELKDLITVLSAIDSNDGILKMLELQKISFVFSSSDLLKIIEVTTSVKTKLGMIQMLAPRLIDPTAKSVELVGMFRYADEKSLVEEVLKARTTTLNASAFKQSSVLNSSNGGSGGGGGGGPGERRTGRGTLAALGGRGRGATGTRKSVTTVECVESVTTRGHTETRASVHFEEKCEEVLEEASGKIKRSTFQVKSRPVTVATAAETAQTKLVAALASNKDVEKTLLSEPEASSETKSPSIVKNEINTILVASKAPPKPALKKRTLSFKGAIKKSEYEDELQRQRAEDEISAVMECLGMDDGNMESASRELEAWEMQVVTNKAEENEVEQGKAVHTPASKGVNGSRHEHPSREFLRRRTSSKSSFSEVLFGRSSSNSSGDGGSPPDRSAMRRKSSFSVITEEVMGFFTPGKKRNSSTEPTRHPSTSGPLPKGEQTSPKQGIRKVSDLTKLFSAVASSPAQSSVSPNNTVAPPTPRTVYGPSSAPVGSVIPMNQSSFSSQHREAAPPSFVLGIDPTRFLAMEPEGPVRVDKEGKEYFSYKELVRRNHTKDYRGLPQTELETYLAEEEFVVRFGVTRDQFEKLTKWRRVALKKSLLLF